MQNIHLFKKIITGSVAVLLSVTLGACGQHATTSSSSSSSSSVRSAKHTSTTSAYKSANKLIQKEDYQGAYNRLTSVANPSTKENNLAADLKNYLNARSSYQNGDYATASSNLKEQKSNSSAMRDAYTDLQQKISKAQGSTASSSNQAANKNSSSQSSTDTTNDNVVVEFANKMGFSGDKGYQIIQTDKSGNTYKLEVRRSNSDNTVSNLVGIYQYNSQTGAVTKLS